MNPMESYKCREFIISYKWRQRELRTVVGMAELIAKMKLIHVVMATTWQQRAGLGLSIKSKT